MSGIIALRTPRKPSTPQSSTLWVIFARILNQPLAGYTVLFVPAPTIICAPRSRHTPVHTSTMARLDRKSVV